MSDSLYSRLKELSESDLYSFHMPGHKRLFPDENGWYEFDISEITGFDYLHSPESIILNAQMKAAELYQADESFYLVNGSTAGILSAVSAVSNGKKLLILRNSHFSVYHGAYLNNLALVYIYPRCDDETGIIYGVTAEDVREKLEKDPDIGAVLITSPTYEGICSDILGIAEIVHAYGACLIVDQAHGAHFGFHPAFPENAVKQGADIVIHSLHKTLPALTQTALLHVNGERINRNRLKRFLRIFQSSSPSYPLMAGIERCLDFVKNEGRETLEKMLEMRNAMTDQVGQLNHFTIIPKTDANHEKGTGNLQKLTTDPCKLIILTKDINGFELARILREKYLLEMEMATDKYVTAIITMMDKPEGLNRLADALKEIDSQIPITSEKAEINTYTPYAPEIVMNIKEAYDGDRIEVPLSETEGKIAAEFAYFYPPGIPLIVPGEKVDCHIIPMLKKQGETFWILR